MTCFITPVENKPSRKSTKGEAQKDASLYKSFGVFLQTKILSYLPLLCQIKGRPVTPLSPFWVRVLTTHHGLPNPRFLLLSMIKIFRYKLCHRKFRDLLTPNLLWYLSFFSCVLYCPSVLYRPNGRTHFKDPSWEGAGLQGGPPGRGGNSRLSTGKGNRKDGEEVF